MEKMEKLDPLKSKMSEHHFSEAHFEKSLSNLKNTQESISGLSSWCLQHKQHHKKIVNCWFKIMKKATIENRLILFYLANDVIQYSKRKNYDFVNTWALVLQRSVTLVRDDKVKTNISRIFKIWGERGVYDETFIADLKELLDCQKGVSSDTAKLVAEFQPLRLVDKIRGCKILEDDTDLKLKHIKEYPLDLTNADTLRSSLKDRRHGADLVSEVDQGMVKIQSYVTSLKEEIKERAKLIELLEQGEVFYEHQKGEAKIVVTAYKNFGFKVKKLLKAAEETLPTLSSPIPSPDINAPSPSGSDDLQLPDAQEHKFDANSYAAASGANSFLHGGPGMGMGGSFIGSNIFDFQNNPIEVIGSSNSSSNKKPDEGFNINEFIKCLNPVNAPPPPPPTLQQLSRPPPMPSMPQISNSMLANFSTPPPPPPPPEQSNNYDHMHERKWFNQSREWNPNKAWPRNDVEREIDWGGPEKKMRFEEAPGSPPMFEKEGFNQPVQYDDRTGIVPEDVDHRAGRNKKDIDHRNLISLTGHPGSLPKSGRNSADDSDLRLIPPLLSKKIEPPPCMLPKMDMNESVDMELSDEEPDSAKRKKNGSEPAKKPLLPNPVEKLDEPEWNPPPPGSEEDPQMQPHLNFAHPPPMDGLEQNKFGAPQDDFFRQPGEFFRSPPPGDGFGPTMGQPSGFGSPQGGPFRPRPPTYEKYNPGYSPGFTNRGPPGGNGSGTMMRGAHPRFRGPSPSRPFRGRGRAHFARW